MTIYRRWPDMHTLLSDLMAREWSGVVEQAATRDLGEHMNGPSRRDAFCPSDWPRGVTGTVRALRDNGLFHNIVEVDPELLLPYILDRRGRTQDSMLEVLEAAITGGQAAETIRVGDPHAHRAVFLSLERRSAGSQSRRALERSAAAGGSEPAGPGRRSSPSHRPQG